MVVGLQGWKKSKSGRRQVIWAGFRGAHGCQSGKHGGSTSPCCMPHCQALKAPDWDSMRAGGVPLGGGVDSQRVPATLEKKIQCGQTHWL